MKGVFIIVPGGVLILAGEGLATAHGSRGGADLAHLGFMEGLARLEALGLLLLVVIERDSRLDISRGRGEERRGRT